jgi:hypothetical protein
MLVVVRDELTQDSQQVPRVVDQHPIQTLAANRAYPPFRVRVRPRCLRRISMPSLVKTSSNTSVYFAAGYNIVERRSLLVTRVTAVHMYSVGS